MSLIRHFMMLTLSDHMNIPSDFAMACQNNLTCYWGNREEMSGEQRRIVKELGYKFRGRNQWLYFLSFKKGYFPYNMDQNEVRCMTSYLALLKDAILYYRDHQIQVKFEAEETFFYSVSIYIFGVVFGMTEFSATALIRHCLPLMTEQYWFIRAYFVLYLLVPPLNAMIRAMGSRVHKYAIVALFVPLCVVGTLVYLPVFENMNPWFSDELWFIELYLIAAYVKLYPSAFTESRKLHFALSAAITLFIWASFLIMDPICAWYNPGRPEEEGLYAYFLSSQFTITGFLCAFFYFLAFKNMRLPSLPVVDYVATTVFGVYLIHTHPLLLKRMWQGVFSTVKYFGTFWFVPASVGVCLATFVICGVIDKIRYYLLERPLFRLLDPALQKLQEKVFPSEEKKENLLQIMH